MIFEETDMFLSNKIVVLELEILVNDVLNDFAFRLSGTRTDSHYEPVLASRRPMISVT